jgi:uncharacterized protein YggE
MADVQITVRGSSETKHAPEQATVHLSVSIEGATRDGVYGGVSSSASSITAQITPMANEHDGPVTWWTSDQIRTWSHRPWNEAGRQLPQVHHAAVDFQVRFNDFRMLSHWITSVVALSGVTVSGIEWSLTDARRATLEEQTRAGAVHNAREKATSYAHNLGLGVVRPVAIADMGMLEQAQHSGESKRAMAAQMYGASAMGGGGEEVLDFTPQEIVVASYVDARFLA